ncbi:cation diffusion facilitator family transporter [Rubeoparvulum massiliense]|uniref:cation diffusion facilitator family transporter n=1 Tax=Rubeoparvulum massiliense TaxID=1631346 RepID=UPI00065DF6AA|nr:cation diffusion facilitator family transporter [Rubeoparvulum massiliense]
MQNDNHEIENRSHDHDHMHEHVHEHQHGHSHHHGHAHHRSMNQKSLRIALGITSFILIVEVIGGWLTNSLALLSDAGHMFSDAGSLALSLVAFRLATRPPSPDKTYGLYRFEILAALFNGATLFLITGIIIWEAWKRLFAPPEVAGGMMMVIAAIGLVANLLSATVMHRMGDVKENVNLRGAYLHVLSDALGSVGAILAGLAIMLFQWYWADPIISIVVAVLIFRSAWGLVYETVHILLEGTPSSIEMEQVVQLLLAIPGVHNVHDLHCWTITSGMDSLSCHLLVDDDVDEQVVLQEAIHRIEEHCKIQHTTIQVEKSHLQHAETEF